MSERPAAAHPTGNTHFELPSGVGSPQARAAAGPKAGHSRFAVSAKGINGHVTFKYCLCPETNIADLWPNYMDHITAEEAQEIWLLDFRQFESMIEAMDISSTLPCLIQQLDDARQAKIYPVYRKNRVCDLVTYQFFCPTRIRKNRRKDLPEDPPRFGSHARSTFRG